jgi:hypothetical protein
MSIKSTSLYFYGKEANIIACLQEAPVCSGMEMTVGWDKGGDRTAILSIESRDRAAKLHSIGECLGLFGFDHETSYQFRQRMLEAMSAFDEKETGRDL